MLAKYTGILFMQAYFFNFQKCDWRGHILKTRNFFAISDIPNDTVYLFIATLISFWKEVLKVSRMNIEIKCPMWLFVVNSQRKLLYPHIIYINFKIHLEVLCVEVWGVTFYKLGNFRQNYELRCCVVVKLTFYIHIFTSLLYKIKNYFQPFRNRTNTRIPRIYL